MDDEGLMKVFSNKIFIIGLLIVAVLSISFYKKTEEQVQKNIGATYSYEINY